MENRLRIGLSAWAGTDLHLPGRNQAANWHGVLAQSSQADFRARAESVHDKRAKRARHRFPQRFPEHRQTAADHDEFRMKEMRHMGKPEGQILRRFLENGLRLGVKLLQGGSQEPCFSTRLPLNQPAQQTRRSRFFEPPDPGIDRPAGTSRFKNRPFPIQPQVADLRFARFSPMIDGSINDQPSSDPSPSQVAVAHETHQQLLEGQPQALREVIALKRQDYSNEEVAARTGQHPRKVQRALQGLKERFTRLGGRT